MDRIETLSRARAQFESRLHLVRDDQWATPTPCEGWTVHDLVLHAVGGNRMTDVLLHGGTREEAIAAATDPDALGEDALGAFARSADAQAAAFGQPGVFERVVPHPAFDMPVTQLFGFRVGDLTIHSWDLARAIGADEELDPDVVAVVFDSLAPLAEVLPASGVFGTGPSGTVGDDAPLQQRMLDLSGRRP